MNPSDTMNTDPLQERCWEQGWEGHERLQLRRMATLSLAEKLQWLEEAQELVRQMQASKGSSPAAIPKDS